MQLGLSREEIFELHNKVADALGDPDRQKRDAQIWQLTAGRVPVLPAHTPEWQVFMLNFFAAALVTNNMRIESQLREAGISLPYD